MQEILNHSGEYGLYFIGILFIGVGYVGSVMPSLPGPPIALIAIYLVHFTVNPFSTIVLFALTILALSLAVLDYFLPVLGTKKFGGSKSGVRGSTIGLILGVILTLMTSGLGIILLLLGPFVGAYFGEKYAGNSHKMALNHPLELPTTNMCRIVPRTRFSGARGLGTPPGGQTWGDGGRTKTLLFYECFCGSYV